jgi:hypothetical protein
VSIDNVGRGLRLREGRGEEECSQDRGFHEGSVSGRARKLCGSSPYW